jgi:hypothetical protein
MGAVAAFGLVSPVMKLRLETSGRAASAAYTVRKLEAVGPVTVTFRSDLRVVVDAEGEGDELVAPGIDLPYRARLEFFAVCHAGSCWRF